MVNPSVNSPGQGLILLSMRCRIEVTVSNVSASYLYDNRRFLFHFLFCLMFSRLINFRCTRNSVGYHSTVRIFCCILFHLLDCSNAFQQVAIGLSRLVALHGLPDAFFDARFVSDHSHQYSINCC